MDLKSQIRSQIPRHIRKSYPYMVEFLQAYFEWLDQDGNPYSDIKKHLDYHSMRESMHRYTQEFKSEYLDGIPENVLANRELFIKFSKQFNQSIGSKKSFEFLFNVLFNESIELYYPKQDLFRLSNSKWRSDESVIMVTNSGDAENFLYRQIVQRKEKIPGQIEEARAVVQNIKSRYLGQYSVSELYVVDVEGEFEYGFPIDFETYREWPMPTSSTIKINNGGYNFEVSDRLNIDFESLPQTEGEVVHIIDRTRNEYGDAILDAYAYNTSYFKNIFTISYNASLTKTIDTRVSSTLSAGDIAVTKNGASYSDFTFDGRYLRDDNLEYGDVVEIEYPIYEGFIVVNSTNLDGSIESVEIMDTPIGLMENIPLISSKGEGQDITLSSGVIREIPGRYMSQVSHLSNASRLQDSFYYQEYSYVIKTGRDIEQYRDIVLDLLHPAGMQMFGQINITDLLNMHLRSSNYRVSLAPVPILSESRNHFGPRLKMFDLFRDSYDLTPTYKERDWQEYTQQEIENEPNKSIPYVYSAINKRYDHDYYVYDPFIGPYEEGGWVDDYDNDY